MLCPAGALIAARANMPGADVGASVVERDVDRRGPQAAGHRRSDRHDLAVDRHRTASTARRRRRHPRGSAPDRARTPRPPPTARSDCRSRSAAHHRAARRCRPTRAGRSRCHRSARAARPPSRHRRRGSRPWSGHARAPPRSAGPWPGRRRARSRSRRRTRAIVSWRASSLTAASCSANAAADDARAAAASGEASVSSGSPAFTRSPVLTWTAVTRPGDRHVDLRDRAVTKRHASRGTHHRGRRPERDLPG